MTELADYDGDPKYENGVTPNEPGTYNHEATVDSQDAKEWKLLSSAQLLVGSLQWIGSDLARMRLCGLLECDPDCNVHAFPKTMQNPK